MTFQGHTPHRDVYYHFECVTIAQYARFAAPDGTISSKLEFHKHLKLDVVDMIDALVFQAHSSDLPVHAPKVVAPWQLRARKAAKRRARRLSKSRVGQSSSGDHDMEVDGEDEVDDDQEESVASGTEFDPET
jgi:hypothetical protein